MLKIVYMLDSMVQCNIRSSIVTPKSDGLCQSLIVRSQSSKTVGPHGLTRLNNTNYVLFMHRSHRKNISVLETDYPK